MKQLFLLAYYVMEVLLLIAAIAASFLVPPLLLARAMHYVWDPHPGPIGGIVTVTLGLGWILALALLSLWLMMRERRSS